MHHFVPKAYNTASLQALPRGRLEPGSLICTRQLVTEDVQAPCEWLYFCSTQPGGNCPYRGWEGEEKPVSEDVPEHRPMMTQKFSAPTLILKLLIETLGSSMVWSMRGLNLTNIYPKS